MTRSHDTCPVYRRRGRRPRFISCLRTQSGIPNYASSPERAKIDRTGATPQQIIELVANTPLDFTPGTNRSYSNTGYILLGMIVEKVPGQSYAEFLRTNIFEPLEIRDSGYDRARNILKRGSFRIRNYQRPNRERRLYQHERPISAGGIYSTVEDVYSWNEALAKPGTLLSAQSLKEMFSEYSNATHEGQHYGYES